MNKLTELKNRFLKWFYQYIEQESHRQHGADVKCPGCQEWFSVSGIKHAHTIGGEEYGFTARCGQCNRVSHWNCEVAPIALRCDSNGGIL